VLPEGAAAAEEVAEMSRRARGAGEEITQDIPEERSGSGPERRASGGRSAGRAAEAKESQSDAAPGSDEESDWEFNNNTNGDFERGAAKGVEGDDGKPEIPEVAPARGRLADDWFGGGAGDAALELEDRSPPAQAAAPAPAPPLRQPPAPTAAPRALPPVPAREPAPAASSPPPREVAPVPELASEPEPEPAPDLDLDLDLSSEPKSPPPREVVRVETPAVTVERRVPKDPADELGSHTWGDLLAAAEETELPPPRAVKGAPALRSKATLQLSAWLGRFGHALGAGLTLALFGTGLLTGLTPVEQPASASERVAGLELDSVEARYVENASAGTLFVVSGRVRNPGASAVPLGRLTLELLDAQGHALGSAVLHAPAPLALLREGSIDALTQLPRLSGEVGPGEVRSFEALVASLPTQAHEYRIGESQTQAPDAAPR
jgi:hypothetical protein